MLKVQSGVNDWLKARPDESRLQLLPDPVAHLHPELPPPPPDLIGSSHRQAELRRWIPEDSPSSLYVSAGNDTRPFTYLRPEVISGELVADSALPRFFVFVDRDEPRTDNLALEFEDGRTSIQTVEQRQVETNDWGRASLLRIRVESSRYPDRGYAVLRIKGDNQSLFRSSLSEAWSPDWFIGIRDGCRMWRNASPCTNVLDSPDSIPLRLGVSFWLTDHLWSLPTSARNRAVPFSPENLIAVPNAGHLRELKSWRNWPETIYGTDRWVTLFRLERDR